MDICKNRLLNTLPKSILRSLIKDCELIQLFYGEVIFESDEKIENVYFPLDCEISLLNEDNEGNGKQIASIDNKGAAGTEICLNENPSKRTAIVTQTGWAYKVDKISYSSAFKTIQCPSKLFNYAFTFGLQIALDENERRRIQFSYDILSLSFAVDKESLNRNKLLAKYRLREKSKAA